MPTDATGAPTPLGIPKFNTSVDAPSGLGSNAQMDALDALIAARVTKPAGIVVGEAAVWNSSGWDRSSVTKITANGLTGITAMTTADVTAANSDVAWGGASATTWLLYISPTGGGTVRSLAAPTVGAGARVSIRNAAAASVTIKNNLAGGTGAKLFTQDNADLILATNDNIEFVYDGTSWWEISRKVAGSGVAGISVLNRVTALVDVNTSVAETPIFSFSVPGNTLSTNKMLRLSLRGEFLHNNVAGDTLTLRIKFGGTTFYANASNLGNVLGAGRHPWRLDLEVENLGATNSQFISANYFDELANTAAPTTGLGNTNGAVVRSVPLSSNGLGAIDTTIAQTLDVTVQWSASSANNSWRMRYAVLELV